MRNRLTIYLTDKEGNDLPSLFIDVSTPHHLAVDESIVVSKHGWIMSVETTMYDIIYQRWSVELETVALSLEDNIIEGLLNSGWQYLHLVVDEPIPANPAAWVAPTLPTTAP